MLATVRAPLVISAFICLACVLASQGIARADAKVAYKPPPIKIPDGFTIELAAEPPLVKHSMLAAFHDRGRLFVAETDGVNLK